MNCNVEDTEFPLIELLVLASRLSFKANQNSYHEQMYVLGSPQILAPNVNGSAR